MGSVPMESILNLKYISCVRHIRKINDSGCPGLGISFMIFVFERRRVAVSRVGRATGPGLYFQLRFALRAAPFRGHGLPSPSLSLFLFGARGRGLGRGDHTSCADQHWARAQACKMCPTELCADQSPAVDSVVSTGSQEAERAKGACTLKV